MDIDYKLKALKYKKKYLNLKKIADLKGGVIDKIKNDELSSRVFPLK